MFHNILKGKAKAGVKQVVRILKMDKLYNIIPNKEVFVA